MSHKYSNIPKVVKVGDKAWSKAAEGGLLNIKVRYVGDCLLESEDGHRFVNMCSCSYLGLNVHPKILQSAIEEIQVQGIVDVPTSRLRIIIQTLSDTEDALAELFGAQIITGPSCGTVSQGILPLIAAGEFTQEKPPIMVFDKNAHFSMNVNKAACADETEVLTCDHNDLDYLETICKKNPLVAYVADGTYSMGGHAPIAELLALQERYGLFLYFDDSHALSAYGKKGCGFIRDHIDEVPDRMIIAATLSKAFGASGAVAMVGPHKKLDAIRRYGGGLAWSQYLNSATIGMVKGSIGIHQSDELVKLQNRLKENLALFDSLIKTPFYQNDSSIRLIILNDEEKAIACAQQIYEKGFYCSAVFFPVVARGKAGLRIMIRANMTKEMIERFCRVVSEVLVAEGVESDSD